MLMQRHGNYDRSTGHLTEEGGVKSRERAYGLLKSMLDQIPEEERKNVHIAVVASPTKKFDGQRSIETAEAVLESVRRVFAEYSLPEENIMSEAPRASAHIEEPRIFKDNTGFREFLAQKHGDLTREFWQAYEEEWHEEERKALGSEGPVEMSDRFAHFTNVLGRYARQFHAKNKENPKRLIIWNVSHYDTVTTYFKNHVANIPQKEYLPVDYDGGLSLMIDVDGKASVTMQETTYPIELTQSGTSLDKQRHENIVNEVP